MARAKRHYIPGHVWHLTHRCHKREFLLRFAKDRQRWLQWLFEAKKRYGLVILNYMATSNHIHLLVFDGGGRDVIPKSMQLIAGRTGQEYNQRKMRKGAFWEDRYHATAVESGNHLLQCLVYIDLNMVRAGVVKHPSEWAFSGYNEIQKPRQRYALIDDARLMNLVGIEPYDLLKDSQRRWVEASVSSGDNTRVSEWTQSIAVGSKDFIESTKLRLGIHAQGRKVSETESAYQLREPQASYNDDFAPEKEALRAENTYFGNIYPNISMQ